MADKEYIDKHEAYLLLKQKAETYMLPATKEAYEKAAILIDSLPTIEAEPDNGWISVEDKMPDECQEVLIYCPEFLEEIRKALYTEGDFYIEKEDLIVEPALSGCTHWMPLPKQPKGV